MEATNKTLYKADYYVLGHSGLGLIDPYYYYASDNDEAYKEAKQYEKQGIDYADIGHQNISLVQIAIVDEETETLKEKELIYY